MNKYINNYASQFLVVLTNVLAIGVGSRFLPTADFSKFLFFNLVLNLSVIFEAGAVPIFSKVSKFNLLTMSKRLEILYYRRIALFFVAGIVLLILANAMTIEYFAIENVWSEVSIIEWLTIAMVCFAKVSNAPNRGVILGSERFFALLSLQFMDSFIKASSIGILIYLGEFTFFHTLLVYLLSNSFILVVSFRLRGPGSTSRKIDEPGILYSEIKDEFRTITFGTGLWVFFSNIDKVLIGLISDLNFFSTYSIGSTVASFQNNIFGPAVPVIGQRLLRREKNPKGTYKEVLYMLIIGFLIFLCILIVLWNFLDTILIYWLGESEVYIDDAVKFAMYLSIIPLCHAGNSLCFHFQFSFSDLSVYRAMNLIAPITNSVVLLLVTISGQIEKIPLFLALASVILLGLNLLWIGSRLNDY